MVLSYGALWANSQELAARWRREGLRAGNVVALSFPNHVGYFVSYLACAIGGFLACPIPDSHHPAVKRKLVAAAAPSLVVTEPPAIDPARSAIPDADALAGPNRPLLLPFSSGSTGDPKPIALGLRGVLGAAESFGRLTELGEDTVLYHVRSSAGNASAGHDHAAPERTVAAKVCDTSWPDLGKGVRGIHDDRRVCGISFGATQIGNCGVRKTDLQLERLQVGQNIRNQILPSA